MELRCKCCSTIFVPMQHLGERDVIWDWIYRLDGSCGEDNSTLTRTKNWTLHVHPRRRGGDSAVPLICAAATVSSIGCKPHAFWLRTTKCIVKPCNEGEVWFWSRGAREPNGWPRRLWSRRHSKCLSAYPLFLHLTLLLLRCLTFSQALWRQFSFSDTHSFKSMDVLLLPFFTQHISVLCVQCK